jgi:hypothetical protein
VDFATAKGKPNRTKLDANTVAEGIRKEATAWCAKSLQGRGQNEARSSQSKRLSVVFRELIFFFVVNRRAAVILRDRVTGGVPGWTNTNQQ